MSNEVNENDFKNLGLIQEGKVDSKVYLVQHHNTKEFFALKKIERTKENESYIISNVRNEIDLNLLLYAANIAIPQLHCFWSTTNYYFLLFTYIDGIDLGEFIKIAKKNNKHISFNIILQIFQQCVDLCHQLYSLHIFHRDIKPENFILSFSTNRIYLIDFELAFYIYHPRSTRDHFYLLGIQHIHAPESLESKFYIQNRLVRAKKIYSWCLGNLFFFLTHWIPIFPFDQSERLGQNKYSKFRKNKNGYQSKKFLHWIRSYARLPYIIPLHLFPLEEYSVDIIFFLAFLMNDLLEQLLQNDPQVRLSLCMIKKHPLFLPCEDIKKFKFTLDSSLKKGQEIILPPIEVIFKEEFYFEFSVQNNKAHYLHFKKDLRHHIDAFFLFPVRCSFRCLTYPLVQQCEELKKYSLQFLTSISGLSKNKISEILFTKKKTKNKKLICHFYNLLSHGLCERYIKYTDFYVASCLLH